MPMFQHLDEPETIQDMHELNTQLTAMTDDFKRLWPLNDNGKEVLNINLLNLIGEYMEPTITLAAFRHDHVINDINQWLTPANQALFKQIVLQAQDEADFDEVGTMIDFWQQADAQAE